MNKYNICSFHVHYVDFHLTGRDYTFAVETSGGDYSLVLQAASLDEREDWIFAIEEAILCRESYQETHNSELKQNVQDVLYNLLVVSTGEDVAQLFETKRR
ncbi:hypothetical protein DYB28_007222 [Aphanomyces astaci]|uniref:PH domain-containing protein n=1 Tax=Aphanomyces astaci TaxID=112090 RepID=A0A9X8E4P2_APHAT|nr:hypothetical protein DYB28_007222 [Aphanomyces astaci]